MIASLYPAIIRVTQSQWLIIYNNSIHMTCTINKFLHINSYNDNIARKMKRYCILRDNFYSL